MFSACSIIEIALHEQVLITQWDNFDMGFHLRKRTVRCQLLTVTVYHCQLISVICKMGSAGMQRWSNNAMLKKYFEKVNSTLATTVVFTSNHAFTEQKENRYSPSYPPPPPTRTGNIHIYILDVRYNLHLYNLYMNTYYINFLSLQSFFFF